MPKGPAMRENVQSATNMDEIFENPNKFGVPTFEQFSKNPDKYRRPVEGLFETADKGSTVLKGLIKEHVYEIMGYRTKSLEEVQRIMRNEGANPDDYEMRPELERLTAGKLRAIVRIVKKKPKGIITDGKSSP